MPKIKNKNERLEKKDPRTRKLILEILKAEGALDSAALASRLDLTAMAIRQHLYALEAEKFIDYQEEPRPVGRPAKLWRLTAAANKFFPDAHAEALTEILSCARKTYGQQGLESLIEERGKLQFQKYLEEMNSKNSLAERLAALAEIRSREGYMALVEKKSEREWLLIENHCPICSAAKECQKFCSVELSLFQKVLGPDVRIERIDHVLQGARRCAYRIEQVGGVVA